ncbi:Ras-related protein Rab-43 [Lucilia cuprina]|nr:Ras-related protein Rab-43 [Lucilia cuprina]
MVTQSPNFKWPLPERMKVLIFYFKGCVLLVMLALAKPAVVERFKTGNFIERHGNTIGYKFGLQAAGQERLSYTNQIYDITSRESFSNLQKWIEEVRRYTASSVMLIVVGNKCDLEDEREVEFEEAQQMCQYIPEVLLVMETSAKENRNVDDAFVTLASELKRRIDTSIRQEENADDEAIKLGHSKPLRQCSSSCNLT